MMKHVKKENFFCNVRLCFVILVLIYSLARQNITALQPYLMSDIINLFVIFVAGGLFAWQFLFFRKSIKTKHYIVLCCVFVVTLISTVLNIKYGYVDNLKAAANMFIQLFVLYAVYPQKNRSELKKDINIIYAVVGFVWFIAAAISVYMYFADIFYMQTSSLWFEPEEIVQGFVQTHKGATVMRLWGVFVDPNFASAVSIIIICLALFSIVTVKSRIVTAINIVNIIVQFLYVVLSNSRMAVVISILLAFVGTWYIIYPYLGKKYKKVFVKELLAFSLAIVVASLSYTGILVTKKVLPYEKHFFKTVSMFFTEEGSVEETTIALEIESTSSSDEQIINSEATTAITEEITSTENVTQTEEVTTDSGNQVEGLDRQDMEVKSDISNGRFRVWLEGLKLWKEQPLFGFGPRNYHVAISEINPSSSIAVSSIHNSYVEFIVGNGLVGMLFLLLFFILCLKDALIHRYKHSWDMFETGMLMIIILGCLACGVFLANLFYYLSFTSMIMFVLLGYALAFFDAKEETH